MTRVLSGADVAEQINLAHPGAVIESNDTTVWVEPESLLRVAAAGRSYDRGRHGDLEDGPGH